MKRKLTVLFSAFVLAASLGAASPFVLPPFTFAGRVTDYAHVAFDADQKVEVRVTTTNGTLVAKSYTSCADGTVYNFVVDVPLATAAAKGFVTVGTPVRFEFVDPDGKVFSGIVPESECVVGQPGGFKSLTVVLATDADGDGIADEYVDALAYLMWKNGVVGKYDPGADYDADGVDNYSEYCAGTNPFDATDRFSIRLMSDETRVVDGYRLRFLANQGRAYSVETATDLAEGDWRPTAFIGPDGVETDVLTTGGTETGFREIEVVKEGVRRFWRLVVR